MEKTKNLKISIAWIEARCWHPNGPYLSSLDVRQIFLHSLEPHEYLDTIKVLNYVLQWCGFLWNTDILLIQMESQLDFLKIKLTTCLFVQLNIYNFTLYKCCLFIMQLNFASYENSYSLHTNSAFHLINFLVSHLTKFLTKFFCPSKPELTTSSTQILERDIVGFGFAHFLGFVLFFFPNPKWSNGNLMSALREKLSLPNHFHVGLYADYLWGILSNTELKSELIVYLCCVVATFIPVPVEDPKTSCHSLIMNSPTHFFIMHCLLDFFIFLFE